MSSYTEIGKYCLIEFASAKILNLDWLTSSDGTHTIFYVPLRFQDIFPWNLIGMHKVVCMYHRYLLANLRWDRIAAELSSITQYLPISEWENPRVVIEQQRDPLNAMFDLGSWVTESSVRIIFAENTATAYTYLDMLQLSAVCVNSLMEQVTSKMRLHHHLFAHS